MNYFFYIGLNQYIAFFATLTAVVIISTVAHYLIEKKCINFLKNNYKKNQVNIDKFFNRFLFKRFFREANL